jgi:hypothetical protein
MRDDEAEAGKERSSLNGAPVACAARTRAGHPCRQPAMRNGRCRQHGGLSLRGLAHPGFKHGRRSRYVPHGLIEEIENKIGRPWPGVGTLPHAGATILDLDSLATAIDPEQAGDSQPSDQCAGSDGPG